MIYCMSVVKTPQFLYCTTLRLKLRLKGTVPFLSSSFLVWVLRLHMGATFRSFRSLV